MYKVPVVSLVWSRSVYVGKLLVLLPRGVICAWCSWSQTTAEK